ncbi:ABC transporter ATP-binding protein [Candidatus Bathyarchaeota archaeon]|jgi:molybdopterin-binding protein|nr:ABC transporter ATP-binding protein [Candidatus Bathyarchaeota archaeon]MBT4319065.1 ABC transporter ATP-binding protein [Candidatus Bathyarchaeota archaeon]MBT4424359.1 ABC transporter ATP-binding protein [Candidatus Bathyarchaeota archaeon]MBT5642644.1 ABC transporter ATP-binding protein [Candidatus Bathyarchaeota archaeon]MBT6604024.1 ABC transporter ATP-binding protein [Candidatus Bathyarchaeota archaeon]
MSIFEIKGLVREYDGEPALKNININIGAQALGVIGKSGSGKTTLLKILAGLLTPSQGKLSFNGTEVTPAVLLDLRRRVTMVFQTPQFLNGTVRTNLSYGLRIRGVSDEEIKRKVSDALDLVSLEAYGERYARNLSGGEQQRVALARALILDPEVLLLDEPTSNLDPVNVSLITDILVQESEKRLVVISTHDLDQVKRIAKHVIFLEEGIITEQGDPYKLDSVNRFTENVYTGISNVEKGVSQVHVGDIIIRTSSPLTGRISLHVRPQDIIISKGWIETSARNQFRGLITGVNERDGIVMIDIDVGEVFTVQITRRSFNEMSLKLGEPVNISFKASSVLPL